MASPARWLRWTAVIVPVVSVVLLHILLDKDDDLMREPVVTLAVPLIVLISAIAFGHITFGRIDRLSAALHERNAALELRNAENERLQNELREMAILGERERIAREMHDGLAQVLGYVGVKAQAVEELLAVGRTDAARGQLAELAAAARSVYVDVREAIVGLASPVAADRGLVGGLEEYVVRFAELSKVAASVSATPAAHDVRLAPGVQAQVLRIAQEALTNVRKHAAAQRARLDVDVDEGSLILAVEDDGLGFDPNATPTGDWPHYGMRSIRDRAEAIGGSAQWSSRRPMGTTFRLLVPIVAERT